MGNNLTVRPDLTTVEYWIDLWRTLKDVDTGRDMSINAPQLHKIEGIILGIQIANAVAVEINSQPLVVKHTQFLKNQIGHS